MADTGHRWTLLGRVPRALSGRPSRLNLAWMEASKGCEVRGNGHGIIIVSDTDKSRHRTGMGQLIGECWHQWVPKKVQNTVLWKSVRCT